MENPMITMLLKSIGFDSEDFKAKFLGALQQVAAFDQRLSRMEQNIDLILDRLEKSDHGE